MFRSEMWEPGSQSVRSQLGIEQEDPRVFRPYTLDEALRTAQILYRDETLPIAIRSLIHVGIVLDLMPAHLAPETAVLGKCLRMKPGTVRTRRLLWELVDERERFDLVRRACGMILAWRGESAYRRR
jgi:hypothetical protein